MSRHQLTSKKRVRATQRVMFGITGLAGTICAVANCADSSPERIEFVALQELQSNPDGANGSLRTPALDEVDNAVTDGTTIQSSPEGAIRVASSPTQHAYAPISLASLPSQPVSTASSSQPQTVQDELLEHAAALNATDRVLITILLAPTANEAKGWRAFRGGDDTIRSQFIAARWTEHGAAQEPLRNWLAQNGGSQIVRSWLINALSAEVPASLVPQIVARPDVSTVSGAERRKFILPSAPIAYSGKELNQAVRADKLRAAGLTGISATGTRIRLGDIEGANWPPIALSGNWPQTSHPGWNTWNTTPITSRLIVKDCRGTDGGFIQNDGSAYVPDGGILCPLADAALTESQDPNLSHEGHGATATWIMGGSIEHGQDPAQPDAAFQIAHSGIAPESNVYYYGSPNHITDISAIETAVQDHIDVLQYELTDYSNICVALPDRDPIFSMALQRALDGGVVVMSAAGDFGAGFLNGEGGADQEHCRLGYPAMRPETLSVNGVSTSNDGLDLPAYANTSISNDSDHGGVAVGAFPSGSISLPGIDFVAPENTLGRFAWLPDGGLGYSDDTFSGGTSFSTPVVTAGVGLLRQALSQYSDISNAREMMANALLLGDGWDATCSTCATPMTLGRSPLSGVGRFAVRWPGRQDLAAPFQWSWRAGQLGPGIDVHWPVFPTNPGGNVPAQLPSQFTEWKWAAVQTPRDLNQVPLLEFRVEDNCSGDPAGGTLITHTTSYDVRSLIRLKPSDVAGKCPDMRVKWINASSSYNAGPGQPNGVVTVYSADFFHSGPVVDPSTPADLPLTGWWRADFSTSPWAGQTSTGPSGSRALSEGTRPPSAAGTADQLVVSSPAHTYIPASFDGTNDTINSTLTTDQFVAVNSWSLVALVRPHIAVISNDVRLRPAIFSDGATGHFGLVYGKSSFNAHASFSVFQWDTAAGNVVSVGREASELHWHLVEARFDGTLSNLTGGTIRLRVDGSAWSSVSTTSFGLGVSTGVHIGPNMNASKFFNGAVAELMTTNVGLSDQQFDLIRQYMATRYGLTTLGN